LYRTEQYTLNTTIFSLYDDDDIRSDNITTGYVYGYNNGVLFAILPDSSRR
jgi:hypothetical protein